MSINDDDVSYGSEEATKESEQTEESPSESKSGFEDYEAIIYCAITEYNANLVSTFATGGHIDDSSVPDVSVEGVGRLSYPLSTEQAATLQGVSTQAPFGKGSETVVDLQVRKAWEIDSSLVQIDQQWLTTSLPPSAA